MTNHRFVYRLAFPQPVRAGRPPMLHAMRDPDAALYLGDVLHERGFRYGGLIPNRRDAPVDLGIFRSDDLILITTRPPLNDREVGDRKPIERSFTQLEDIIFHNVFSRWFTICARSQIRLSDAAADVALEIRARQFIIPRMHGAPVVQAYGSLVDGRMVWRRFNGGGAPTVAFIVHAEHVWEGGPAVLAVWSVAGTPTLAWSAKVARDHRDLLLTTPFAMAELELPAPPAPPMSMAFADAWKATILGVA
jgi:hypothetical protein